MTPRVSEIVERLEKATGPDRELDAHIAAAIGLPMTFCDFDRGCYHGSCESPGCGKPLGLSDERKSYPGDWQDDDRLPRFSESIDSALTLVPEGYDYGLSYSRQYGLETWVQKAFKDGECFQGYAPEGVNDDSTKAIALCIASLKAIAALRALEAKKEDR